MVDSIKNNQLNILAQRNGYNMALRHFRLVQEIAASMGDGYNLADIINKIIAEGRMTDDQIRPIINMLLVDKFDYAVKSVNLRESITNVNRLGKIIKTWTNIQVVVAFYGSNGLVLLNPDTIKTWESALPLKQSSFLVCYTCTLETKDEAVSKNAASSFIKLLYGGQVKSLAGFRATRDFKHFFEPVDALPITPSYKDVTTGTETDNTKKKTGSEVTVTPTVPVQSNKVTGKIGVNVTNELFHNGNVEAWKRIIQSYKQKYPELDILVWYDGERINDLNSLFKWGKVKHGTPILFSVAGENPESLSKLRKYLFEGASSRFEAFLHGSPMKVLALF